MAAAAKVADKARVDVWQVVVWVLDQAIDEVSPDDALALIALVHELTGSPGYDPSRRVDGDGRTFTTARVVGGPGFCSTWLPPVPGKQSWTLVESRGDVVDV